MIFVTGATGLVGSYLIQALAEKQQPVTAMYRSQIPSFPGAENVNWVKGDILDMPFLEEALKDITQVYHCAAVVSFQPKQSEILFKTNVEGTANIVNACLKCGVQKLVYVSSVAALGKPKKEELINETLQWMPETNKSEYGKSKYLAEMEVWRGIGEGLSAVIVNPSIILGDGDWNTGSSQMFKSAYKEFPWYTEGTTGFVYVLDVVNAMIGLMNSNITSERFIVNAENLSYKQVFDMMAEGFGKEKSSKKVTSAMASLIWRAEAVRSLFTGKRPLLTKETAATAQMKIYFNNDKLLKAFPRFRFTPVAEAIAIICKKYKQAYGLI